MVREYVKNGVAKKASITRKRRKLVRPALLKYAGKAKNLPSDAAVNADHYLYGHPKR